MARSSNKGKAPTTAPGRYDEGEFELRVEPWGVDGPDLERLGRRVAERRDVRDHLDDTRNRLLSIEMVERDSGDKKRRKATQPPERFRATFYDYTNNRCVVAEGDRDDTDRLTVEARGDRPLPSPEEFQEAVELLTAGEEFGGAIRAGRLVPYAAMPPLVEIEQADGQIERTLAVGLRPTGKRGHHEIVGVNLVRRELIRFEGGAPPRSNAGSSSCGFADAGQSVTGQGIAGSAWITVRQGGTTLWRLLVVRPSASSGSAGSGLELRFVDYRGKRVLYRAHVPILNVRYDNDACGPYRDWQYAEGFFEANGTDVAPGIRICSTPARSILESGVDAGNFRGVAIYVDGLEVVLKSELEAGWYRYISEWRLHADGTIRPRFGFSAVENSCVCNTHHHHAYWRLDFDIRTPGSNQVREFNEPPIFPASNWHDKTFEIRRPRDPGRKRKWRVENLSTGEAYDVIPGPNDGVATASQDWPFPRGDVWILRYHGSELDDSAGGWQSGAEADLDRYVNGESISGQDVVIWYGAHFTHDVLHDTGDETGHVVGPDLVPVRW